MSYEPNPKWTKYYRVSAPGDFTCPVCGKVAGNVEEVMRPLFSSGYYAPRHIPQKLTFTCDNTECSACDRDFSYVLFVSVVGVREPEEIK